MTIPFSKIPANWRQPLFFVEFDNSQANTAQQQQRTLLIGQMTAGGNVPPNVPVICSGVADAKSKAGLGSMLALMTDAYRQNDPTGEVWILPLSDDGAAVAAAGSVKFTHTATAAGTFNLYVAGVRVQMLVTASQTLAQLATALAAAINANTDLPVTAAVDGGDSTMVDIVARNAGAEGNDIDLRLNFLGVPGGETLPAALTVTIVAMAAGATNPTLTTALANCVDKPFDFIVLPYTDTTSLNALQAFLNDSTGRWSFNRQIYGHNLTAYRGNLSACTTLGAGRNNQHETIVGFYDSPTPNWAWAAAMYGAAAVALRADPGRPVQTLVVNGVLAPPPQSRFASSDREALLYSGIATFTVSDDGTVAIENMITSYQKNAFSQADNSYLEIETLFQLMFLMRNLAGFVTSKYARVKLAADGNRFAPGSGVVTPSVIKQDIIANYRDLSYQGFAQNPDAFAAGIVVEQDSGNPNRVNVLWPGTLMDQLRIFALLAQFRLN